MSFLCWWLAYFLSLSKKGTHRYWPVLRLVAKMTNDLATLAAEIWFSELEKDVQDVLPKFPCTSCGQAIVAGGCMCGDDGYYGVDVECRDCKALIPLQIGTKWWYDLLKHARREEKRKMDVPVDLDLDMLFQ
jgi:hypothetical protein